MDNLRSKQLAATQATASAVASATLARPQGFFPSVHSASAFA